MSFHHANDLDYDYFKDWNNDQFLRNGVYTFALSLWCV